MDCMYVQYYIIKGILSFSVSERVYFWSTAFSWSQLAYLKMIYIRGCFLVASSWIRTLTRRCASLTPARYVYDLFDRQLLKGGRRGGRRGGRGGGVLLPLHKTGYSHPPPPPSTPTLNLPPPTHLLTPLGGQEIVYLVYGYTKITM